MSTETLSFRVTGLVQHVWFRGWTQMTARSLGLTGWVRNMPDGSVSGLAQARADGGAGRAALETFCAALENGPPSSRVLSVTITPVEGAERFDDFLVRR